MSILIFYFISEKKTTLYLIELRLMSKPCGQRNVSSLKINQSNFTLNLSLFADLFSYLFYNFSLTNWEEIVMINPFLDEFKLYLFV